MKSGLRGRKKGRLFLLNTSKLAGFNFIILYINFIYFFIFLMLTDHLILFSETPFHATRHVCQGWNRCSCVAHQCV